MGMVRKTLRFPESIWELIEQEAARDSISGAMWVRDSVLLRIGFRAGSRGEYRDVQEALEALLAKAHENEKGS